MRYLAVIACAFGAVAAAGTGSAQELSQEAAQSIARGAELYQRHCAACHGVEGRADGPLASALIVQPADLTQLSVNGVFPGARILERIDGRDPLVSHGSPMPVYGEFFDGPEMAMKLPSGQPLIAPEAMVQLMAWIESIQD